MVHPSEPVLWNYPTLDIHIKMMPKIATGEHLQGTPRVGLKCQMKRSTGRQHTLKILDIKATHHDSVQARSCPTYLPRGAAQSNEGIPTQLQCTIAQVSPNRNADVN
jgi:hypothetical protein